VETGIWFEDVDFGFGKMPLQKPSFCLNFFFRKRNSNELRGHTSSSLDVSPREASPQGTEVTGQNFVVFNEVEPG